MRREWTVVQGTVVSNSEKGESGDVFEKAFLDAMVKAATEAVDELPTAENYGTSEGAKKGWVKRRNGWSDEQFKKAESDVCELVDDLSLKGKDGKGKGWKNKEKSFGELDAGTIEDIQKANPKMKMDGAEAIIDTKQLQHALDGHGKGREKRGNQIPITESDLKKIPDVLSDYDSIEKGIGKDTGKKSEAVLFRKQYNDGTIVCVELDVWEREKGKRFLKFQTMWKEKNEE